jgi:hypothetical protein
MLACIEFPNILPFVLFVALLSNSFTFCCGILLCVWHALIKKLSNWWMLGKKITDYFYFLPPPSLSPTPKMVILFFFSATSSSPNLENCLYLLWKHGKLHCLSA